jgi:hypothetical protein
MKMSQINKIADHLSPIAHVFLGVPLTGRAIRCNLFAFRGKKISTAIPNAQAENLNFNRLSVR